MRGSSTTRTSILGRRDMRPPAIVVRHAWILMSAIEQHHLLCMPALVLTPDPHGPAVHKHSNQLGPDLVRCLLEPANEPSHHSTFSGMPQCKQNAPVAGSAS